MFCFHTTFEFVIREVAFKGRDMLGNEGDREFDYSMFNYRNDSIPGMQKIIPYFDA